jgi:Ca2+-binding RTX toxin-like protein
MAYRAPIGDRWPEFFTDNDINALINVWGAETQLFSTNSDMINGSSYRDILLGAGGNDILRGRNRGDRLEGGRGDDQVMGGPGPDELFGGSGSDQLFGGFGHDTINGGSGEDRIRGGFGSDLFILSRGDDIVEDFRISDHDRLGLRSGIGYELIQEDRHLLVSTELGVTSILDVNLSQFMNNGQIVFI